MNKLLCALMALSLAGCHHDNEANPEQSPNVATPTQQVKSPVQQVSQPEQHQGVILPPQQPEQIWVTGQQPSLPVQTQGALQQPQLPVQTQDSQQGQTATPGKATGQLAVAPGVIAALTLLKGMAVNNQQRFDGFNNVVMNPAQLLPLGSDHHWQPADTTGAKIFYPNASGNADDWHCYDLQGLDVSIVGGQMTVSGSVHEYQYDMSSNTCSSIERLTLIFNQTHIDSSARIASGDIDIHAAGQPATQWQSREILVAMLNQQLAAQKGIGWAMMQADIIANSDQESGDRVLSVDDKGIVHVTPVAGSALSDFNQLDRASLLAGTLFGGVPGSGTADVKWCGIVNIPTDASDDTLKAQAVIATNCARSTPRYCDGFDSLGIPAIMAPATSPIAWDEETALAALDNSREMQQRNQQGHFVTHGMSQNAFVLNSVSSIEPIIGYGSPRTDGHDNNAGKTSFTGHQGHCQNVMEPHHTKMGLAWMAGGQPTQKSFWTQNFQ